jgi:ornithine carbamoyltransferase
MGKISVSNELGSLLERADVLYTDCWPSARTESVIEEIKKAFLPYQITEKHVSKLRGNAVFLPCPPVTRGQEVSSGAMLSAYCKNHEAKQYLLHSQNAVLEFVTEAEHL